MASIYHTLAIFPTDRCNARCDICCLHCGPERDNHLPRRLAEAAIREAGDMENMKTLIISGGEPWLFREEVLGYARLASSLGLSVTLYSNGFWGKDAAAAQKAVRQMKEAGVGGLSFSADRYHQACVPAAHLKNAMEAALEAGLSVELSVMEFADRASLPWAEEIFGEIIHRPGVRFVPHPALAAGRAKERLADEDFWRPLPAALLPCCHAGMIHLTPEGNWLPCCGIGCREVPFLVLGNIRDMTLLEAEERAMEDEVLKIILLEGWRWFARRAKEIGHPFPKTVSLSCECCLFLASHPEFAEGIRKEAMRHAAELAMLRAMGL